MCYFKKVINVSIFAGSCVCSSTDRIPLIRRERKRETEARWKERKKNMFSFHLSLFLHRSNVCEVSNLSVRSSVLAWGLLKHRSCKDLLFIIGRMLLTLILYIVLYDLILNIFGLCAACNNFLCVFFHPTSVFHCFQRRYTINDL